MQTRNIKLEASSGTFALIDYGGSGPDCILIHGTGQNAAAWRACAVTLAARFHVVAFDLRGHGQTQERSSDAEQYWKDIGAIAEAMRMPKPLLIGHSTGAYAATAYVASGGDAAGVVCVDGFTLDGLDEAQRAARQVTPGGTKQALFDMFRYGWRATAAERDDYIKETVAAASGDWLNEGIDSDLLRAMLRRCFIESDGLWLRRPTPEEIAIVSAPKAGSEIFPWHGIYELVHVPLLLVWADRGLSSDRRAEVSDLATAAPNRCVAQLSGSHNLPMQRPGELGRLIMTSPLFDG